jgi:flavin-dependent dehydrogenase
MVDVLIAGAGPAGTVTAIVLARAGVRVRLLDRARFPRHKLCGDSVNPGALAVLRRLGLEEVAAGLPIDGMIVTGLPDVRVVGAYGEARGRTVMRRDFDDRLVRAAAAAGAAVEEGVLVEGPVLDTARGSRVRGLTVKTRAGTSAMRAPVVIAADGRYSRVARGLGLSRSAAHPRRWAVGAYFEGVAGGSSYGEMHVRGDHYIGVAPLAGGLTNACLVTSERNGLGDGRARLLRAVHGDGTLADRFRTARLVTAPVTLGPLAVESSAAGLPGLLLAGDAAGFIDPMTGDGLHFAMRGAELAAAAALRALEGGGDAHVWLARERRRAFASKIRFNRGLRSMVASSAAVRLAGAGASLAPGVLRHVIRYAGDVCCA